jgi:hypothetical protein
MPGFVPTPTPETAPFWLAAAQGRLSIQRCSSCAIHYFYPRPFCPHCGSGEVSWTTVSGRATLISYVINYRPLPPFAPDVPMVVALVRLEEGPHLMTNIVGIPPDPEHLPLDLPLIVTFVERGDVTLPVFAPAKDAA